MGKKYGGSGDNVSVIPTAFSTSKSFAIIHSYAKSELETGWFGWNMIQILVTLPNRQRDIGACFLSWSLCRQVVYGKPNGAKFKRNITITINISRTNLMKINTYDQRNITTTFNTNNGIQPNFNRQCQSKKKWGFNECKSVIFKGL